MNAPHPTSPLFEGLATYHGVLAGAGGRAVETLQRGALAAVLYASPPYALQVPPMDVARVSINLTDSRVEGRLDGERLGRFEAARHSLFVTPAGASAFWHKARPSRHINLYVEARALPDRPVLNLVVPSLRPLIDRLAAELSGSDPFAAEAADSLARLVLVQLQRQPPRAATSSLAPVEQAQLQAFVAAHLDRRLFVHELAAVVGWPPARFALAFARSFGRTPHQYVLDQRIERAAALLQHSALGLADIAAECGFANQQHMTTRLKRRLGATPAQLRGRLRSAG